MKKDRTLLQVVLILLFIPGLLSAVYAQGTPEPSQDDFEKQLVAAFSEGDDASTRTLIRDHRLMVKPFVDKLITESIQAEARQWQPVQQRQCASRPLRHQDRKVAKLPGPMISIKRAMGRREQISIELSEQSRYLGQNQRGVDSGSRRVQDDLSSVQSGLLAIPGR